MQEALDKNHLRSDRESFHFEPTPLPPLSPTPPQHPPVDPGPPFQVPLPQL